MSLDSEDLKVTFFPPLYHQRRIWLLETLRRERITEIIDIGCGEGSLLATLCQPAPWLGPGSSQDDDHYLSSLFDNIGCSDEDTPNLHPKRIAGVDISSCDLNVATECTSPASANPLYMRWEPLEVELWKGSIDVINPALINVECVVATELIEHLTEDILIHVAPIVLGVYRPRLFLITTPSYTFNARWSPPGTRKPGGHPDPTGRTDRVFRHPDHKFEWTVEEFAQWCMTIAHQWGYVVDIGGVGTAQQKDPWGRDKILGGATQVASFKRMDDRVSTGKRERGSLAVHSATNTKGPHELVKRYYYEAHPRAGNPSDLREIGEAMVEKFEQWGETILRIEELWFADDVPILCGGSIEVMINAAERHQRLDLQRIPGRRRGDWKIELVGGVQRRLMDWSPVQLKSEAEIVTMEDDEPEYGMERSSFDSGVHIGNHDDNTWCSEDTNWSQVGGWADEAHLDWGRQ
ncbi:hypothetical protein PAXINDRAFT_117125 [Paxillus involutus ATCC 200175]|uniref:Small RNA 2'-O-methyltransferase n=1 Tax=Paxillus involutus ATCC 200175 TaxID=664439 RepID=A0A0C9U1Y4_PAXIN|nr:hypothetical protein PAXINDRAFT_117125 [Paxillus involutus ATCC 200175]